jgi:hypothetical protein
MEIIASLNYANAQELPKIEVILAKCINIEKTSNQDLYNYNCLEKSIINQKYSPLEQLNLANNLLPTKAGFYCHQLTHIIGSRSYSNLNTLAKYIHNPPYSCSGGFIHGLMEEASKSIKPSTLINIAKENCKFSDNINSRSAFNSCWHGIGHSLFITILCKTLYLTP